MKHHFFQELFFWSKWAMCLFCCICIMVIVFMCLSDILFISSFSGSTLGICMVTLSLSPLLAFFYIFVASSYCQCTWRHGWFFSVFTELKKNWNVLSSAKPQILDTWADLVLEILGRVILLSMDTLYFSLSSQAWNLIIWINGWIWSLSVWPGSIVY